MTPLSDRIRRAELINPIIAGRASALTGMLGFNTATPGTMEFIDAAGNVQTLTSGAATSNAGTATKLATARTILGVSFDGSANIAASIIGTTIATGNTTMTNANTYYTGVTLGSALASGGSYIIWGQASVTENNAATGVMFFELYDSTNTVVLVRSFVSYPATLSGDQFTIGLAAFAYTGYAGTPTIIVRGQSTNGGDVILGANDGIQRTGVTALRVG